MVTRLDIEDFVTHSAGLPVIDVRSPAEYSHAHIPDAISLPLFSNEERSAIGTLFKQQGREPAMMLGLEYYGKNMQRIISDLQKQTNEKQIFIHCWRGGMRSGAVAWMLDLFGYKVAILDKGYKSFRKVVLDSFTLPKNILILGGKTGSTKTDVLHELKKQNEQVIDLEALAGHKGSAFGGINSGDAPSQEQFENNLYFEFRKCDIKKHTWLEDESQRIGSVNIPTALWSQMRTARVIYLEVPFEERLNYIVEIYGSLPIEELKQATLRIQKRLGGLETKNVLQFFEEGNISEAFSVLLKYYDKFYVKATEQRNSSQIQKIGIERIDAVKNAMQLIQAIIS